jgi:hypothetical protein
VLTTNRKAGNRNEIKTIRRQLNLWRAREDRDCDGLERELAALFNISLKRVK